MSTTKKSWDRFIPESRPNYMEVRKARAARKLQQRTRANARRKAASK